MDIKNKELSSKMEELSAFKNMINKISENMKETTKDLDLVKNSLLVHYHKILSEGKDTRKEGLVWVIKAIWNLGQKVVASFIPNFLDEKAISYMYNVNYIYKHIVH